MVDKITILKITLFYDFGIPRLYQPYGMWSGDIVWSHYTTKSRLLKSNNQTFSPSYKVLNTSNPIDQHFSPSYRDGARMGTPAEAMVSPKLF